MDYIWIFTGKTNYLLLNVFSYIKNQCQVFYCFNLSKTHTTNHNYEGKKCTITKFTLLLLITCFAHLEMLWNIIFP